MSKFTFVSEDELNRRLIMKCEEVQLEDIVLRFEEFLRGSGFYFQGSLQIVEPEEEIICDETDHH